MTTTPVTESLPASLREEASAISVKAPYGRPRYVDLMRAAADEIERLRGFVEEIKKLASNPFASEAVALRACLLAAYEALGLPGPQDSPLRQTARAIIAELNAEADGA